MKSLAPSPDSLVQPLVAAGAPAATPIAFVRAIALAYERRGLSPHRALAQAQIAPQLLQDDSARITAWQMEQISDAAMQELDDEALGWFNRRLPWGSYGMLARASISSPTLQVALARWCRHHGLLADDIALHLTTQGETATLAITEARDLGALREFCLVSVLRNAHGLACWLVDSRIPLIAAEFAFDAPPHADAYSVLFRGPVTFHAPRTLHRQLKEEGATLQGLKDEVRRTRAVELLHRTQRPIKQVAEAAGFVNEKSFIRAFRGWTGQSPAEFRRVAQVP